MFEKVLSSALNTMEKCGLDSIWKQCGRSCNKCDETRHLTKPECLDRNSFCADPKIKDRCITEKWIREQCPVSCKICKANANQIPINKVDKNEEKPKTVEKITVTTDMYPRCATWAKMCHMKIVSDPCPTTCAGILVTVE
jgi:hypothetical protein